MTYLYGLLGENMTDIEEKIEDAGDLAEELVDMAEDLGIISEAQEKKLLALIRKLVPGLVAALPILAAILVLK
jgi:hypothetical protein